MAEAGEKPREARVSLPALEEGIVDDVVEIDQALPEEEIEGVRLMLGDQLQMGAPAIPEEIPILEVKEDRQKDQRNEVEKNETPQSLPEQLPGVGAPAPFLTA